jgi:hypothetical protein
MSKCKDSSGFLKKNLLFYLISYVRMLFSWLITQVAQMLRIYEPYRLPADYGLNFLVLLKEVPFYVQHRQTDTVR